MSGAEEQPPFVDGAERKSSVVRALLGTRSLLFLFAFAIEIIIFFTAMAIPIGQAQQQALAKQANDLLNSTSTGGPAHLFLGIFENNARVALLEMIPLAGTALFFFSIFTTGQVIQAIAVGNGLPGPVLGAALFFYPFAIVELSAYAVAVASGSLFVYSLVRKRARAEVRVFLAEGAVVLSSLFLAAAMETISIVAPAAGFALWLPTLVAIVAGVFAARGLRE